MPSTTLRLTNYEVEIVRLSEVEAPMIQNHSNITASCLISNHIVYQNGKAIFENKGVDLREFLLSVYQHLEVKYPKFYKMDNLSKLGWLASEVLLNIGFEKENYQPKDIGIVLQNTNSSLDTDLKYYETTKEMASPALFVYTLPNIVMGEICIKNNFRGENIFFIFEEFDADFLEKYVNNLLQNDTLQACICGWVELVQEEYKAVLMLVEKNKNGQEMTFNVENITKIYNNE